jgi:linoleoyl-CoA desaturase
MDWGETQVRGSANFCNSYKLYTKFMGGINNQIEHHLFPSICNHYLPEIVPIVKQTCHEFNIPYNHIDNPKEVFDSLCKTYFDVYEQDNNK